jgi:DNA polymerase I-like protein with 3'-5' exonuclease and polymerase domains|tara:strand:+ start:7328 stop:9277 length:1950 start_codon:yes stop_codon:yes gene_type:complete
MILPETEWLPPTEFPDLSKYDEIAIDLETRDTDLKIKGSGSIIGNGEVVGIAVAVKDWKGYYPIAHETGPNMNRKQVLTWFEGVLKTPATKIFHNAMYDICWIVSDLKLKIFGRVVDTMIACSLIDENRYSYTLNTLAWVYLNKGKNESKLLAAAKERGLDAKKDMWRLPAMEVGSYAEQDAQLTYELWQKVKKIIVEEDLQSIFDLETDLQPCLIKMRMLGVRVNAQRAHTLKQQLAFQEKTILHKIKKESNLDIQIMAARSIAKLFDKLKLPYDRTLKSNEPSFTKNFLTTHKHPLVKLIAEARKINKVRTTFIDSILNFEHKGRIHSEINQIRSDDGGTVTGRFSYTNPNLQQIPARDPETGPLIRSLFIPEKGCTWGCFDYSQQEPRLVAHYALKMDLPSVNPIADAYDTDKSTDFHQIVADMADIPRTQAKTINLGLFYGMGKAKLQAELGVSKEKAEELFNQYHSKVPFVKQLTNKVMNVAQDRGNIKTLLGRRCRFPKYEPVLRGSDWGTFVPAEDHERMLELQEMGEFLKDEEGKILKTSEGKPQKNYWHKNTFRRAFTYKALNRLIQGSAADMTKKAMLELYKEDIIPHIQIHDELDISIPIHGTAKKVMRIMRECVDLAVPNQVDYERGSNWGDLEKLK